MPKASSTLERPLPQAIFNVIVIQFGQLIDQFHAATLFMNFQSHTESMLQSNLLNHLSSHAIHLQFTPPKKIP